ncbi:MAG: hypothetical protein IJ635_01480 [Bacteroidaceae bacterium]|nr:hypothetical protein [Bacteroidaceae bacterium]MBR1519895.1 hypothetical protein [Bacteroidaceae bacterium]
MKKNFLFLLTASLIASCSPQSQRADYALSWEGDGIGVAVTLTSPNDTVLFTYASDAGGQTDQMSWLQDLTVSQGEVLVDSATRELTILTDGGQARFSYVIRCTLPEGYGSPGGCLMDVFRPDIDDKMLFSRTENIFVVPRDDDEMPVSVTWTSVPDYPVFCLYNAGHGTERFDGAASDISFSVMAGDPLLTVDTVMVDGNLHYLVTALRKNVEKNKADLKDYFRTFYASISNFWNEEYKAPYSMLVFPFRNNTFDMTGNGFRNGFVSRYDATADTIMNKDRRDLFTHEIGHKWLNNGTIWFAEGFDEMQTGYQFVASGLEDPSYFATYFNAALAGLHKNPYRNAAGKEAEERFWDDNDYTWLLYWRGFSYAFHLTGLYEKETGQPNAWKPMMQAVKPFLDDFSAEKFLDAMAKLMDRKRLEKDYQTYMQEGKDFDFFVEDLPTGCKIVRQNDGTPQLVITDSVAFARHFQ